MLYLILLFILWTFCWLVVFALYATGKKYWALTGKIDLAVWLLFAVTLYVGLRFSALLFKALSTL